MEQIIESNNGIIKIFTTNVDNNTKRALIDIANSDLGVNAHMRIMPDCHAGKGCVIGTTMLVHEKVCPNFVGVDIGCGVTLLKFDKQLFLPDFLPQLDDVIRKHVPIGKSVHQHIVEYKKFRDMYSWNALSKEVQDRAMKSLGTLGGGNHFIEAYVDAIAVHSGSRGIGAAVAEYYQMLAVEQCTQASIIDFASIEAKDRQKVVELNKIATTKIDKDKAYLTGKLMHEYLHDMKILQQFAIDNRKTILSTILNNLPYKTEHLKQQIIDCAHNYIDFSNEKTILRKGATSAKKGESVLIPLNMRDGMLICVGKGNSDWNESSPHGAGRSKSRMQAHSTITLDEYKESMSGIYSTCINEHTIDESPMAYKEAEEIKTLIEPTVEILECIKPIYNLKANN
ncbi:MAG: RtcB family protein [Firmicutes bacterium]|nr:RtcB family protein [Bacillota bacterium]MCL1953926.1 RtcB family protein [Bacillota bacterium]